MSSSTKELRVLYSDDEGWIHGIVEQIIEKWPKKTKVSHFMRHDECFKEILREEPDILIMDMIKDNVPGREPTNDIDGFKLLSLLSSRRVKFPILVVSGSFSVAKFEGTAKQFAGKNLKVFFITKPFTLELFHCALDKCVAAFE